MNCELRSRMQFTFELRKINCVPKTNCNKHQLFHVKAFIFFVAQTDNMSITKSNSFVNQQKNVLWTSRYQDAI